MDQQRFESEVLKALGSEAPTSSADEPFEEAAASETEHDEDDYGEGNALEDARVEEMDTFEEGGEEAFLGDDGFEEDQEELNNPHSEDELDALEEAMVGTLAGRNADEFFRTLLRGVGQIAGLTPRGARSSQPARTAHTAEEAATEGAAGVSTAAGRVAGAAREAAQARNPLSHFLHLLRQHRRQGFDELDSLEELSEEFAEGDYDEAIPVLAGLAARSILTAAAGRAVRASAGLCDDGCFEAPFRPRNRWCGRVVPRACGRSPESFVEWRAEPRGRDYGLARCPKQFSVPPRRF